MGYKQARIIWAVVVLIASWQIEVESCYSGRYGRYENWPSTSDWEELLILLTGKYGNNGWGWKSTNSYAYSTQGDYPFGTLKYSSSPWESAGDSHGELESQYSSGISNKLKANKVKEALNSYFKSTTKTNPGWGSNNGGGFVGETFIDSSHPGPPYDDTAQPGPPYPATSQDNSLDAPFAYKNNGFYNENQYESAWPSLQDQPSTLPYHGPHNPNNNQDEAGIDDKFQNSLNGFASNGKTRNGRRRSRYHADHNALSSPISQGVPAIKRQRAGLYTRPVGGFNLLTRLGRNRKRKQMQMGLPARLLQRKKLDTSFGGYRVDHTKLRWLEKN